MVARRWIVSACWIGRIVRSTSVRRCSKIEPGNPRENADYASFNSSPQEELLNREEFASELEANVQRHAISAIASAFETIIPG